MLRNYAMELKERNKHTTEKIQVETNTNLTLNSRVFKRIYVCLGSLEVGFIAGRREILGLDGDFIKGPYIGQILTTVGVDSNNGDDFDLQPNSNFTFILNKQKNPPYKFKWTEKTVPVVEVDACPNACEIWKAIKRLKQGESINVQDLETNLYWEFRKFTSWDGESLESYYSRFYKMMNELVRNKCDVTNHQVNVQFLLQLQPEWQRACGSVSLEFKAVFKFRWMLLNISLNLKNEYVGLDCNSAGIRWERH
nr:hypothetical protein [Tanacetum cinerariifolium]